MDTTTANPLTNANVSQANPNAANAAAPVQPLDPIAQALKDAGLSVELGKLETNLPFWLDAGLAPIMRITIDNVNFLQRKTVIDGRMIVNVTIKSAGSVYSYNVDKAYISSITKEVGHVYDLKVYQAQRAIVEGSVWHVDGNLYTPEESVEQIAKNNLPVSDESKRFATPIAIGEKKVMAILVE